VGPSELLLRSKDAQKTTDVRPRISPSKTLIRRLAHYHSEPFFALRIYI
jgi:hypothetical protein